jgi:hypothetical protein
MEYSVEMKNKVTGATFNVKVVAKSEKDAKAIANTLRSSENIVVNSVSALM